MIDEASSHLEHPSYFTLLPDRADYRPVGNVALSEAVQMITRAIQHARRNDAKNLLVNISGLTGFAPPSLAERYFFIRQWAEASLGKTRVVLVARPEMIDPEKFGATVARNAGMDSNIFASETEALKWLRGEG